MVENHVNMSILASPNFATPTAFEMEVAHLLKDTYLLSIIYFSI